ncbi:MAG: hypothetical protein EHM61_26155 [Acidobacteria bacterium]|nr:MAG: hypothetical protein EHM61_26155 [Acidobacteriota bacterium]
MKSAKILIAIVLTLTLCSVVAAAKPNFTGDWKMVAAKSDFGQMPPPSKFEEKIAHTDPQLKVSMVFVSEMGEMALDSNYTTDGKECVNTSPMGESKSTANWDGDSLVIVTKMDMQGNEITITNRWTLSADGATLTVNGHFSSSQGEGDTKIVMEKK